MSTVGASHDVGGQTRPLTLDDVLAMLEHGILSDDERLELDDGVVFTMSPKSLAHVWTTRTLAGVLSDHYRRPEYVVQTQLTFPLSDTLVRAPDVLVGWDVGMRWFDPADILLVVEVADTSLTRDVERKAVEYGRMGRAALLGCRPSPPPGPRLPRLDRRQVRTGLGDL